MRLRNSYITKSPVSNEYVRLQGEVEYNDSCNSEIYWYDIPQKYESQISDTGNPWLACLLPLAITLGESLSICKPVDNVLLTNISNLTEIYKTWYPELHRIDVEAPVYEECEDINPKRSAAFFSGGVDSYFTVLRHLNCDTSTRNIRINDLLFVCGFDIPLVAKNSFEKAKKNQLDFADEISKNHVSIYTNLRETRFNCAKWGALSHGSALASIALVLEKRYKNILIGSTHDYNSLFPWGSHPQTDPLFSTKKLNVIHDGVEYNRVQKTAYIARSEAALRSLRVCYRVPSDRNCSYCNKCYRTMITLKLLGKLSSALLFDEKRLDVKKIQRIYSRKFNDRVFLDEVRLFALEQGEYEIANSIETSFKYSESVTKWLNRVKRLPFLRRKLKRIILHNSVR